MSDQRMAGSEPILPLILAAAGAMPGLNEQQQGAARQKTKELNPALLTTGDNWWDEEAALPGNTWIFPNQEVEHKSSRGLPDFQYPFFRSALVQAGLLPARAPEGSPKSIRIPEGMSVLDAIEKGVIR